MEEKNLTEKESLELITRMIDNTKDKVKKNAGLPFLIWGYVTVIVALVIWFLVTTTGNHWWQFLWFMILIIGSPLNFLLYKKDKAQVTTYVDRVISRIWLVFGIVVIICSVMAFIVEVPILFLVLLLMSMAVVLSGFIIRFNVAVIFGFLGVLSSFTFLFISGINQILIFAAIFFIMMVIPGHILNHLTKKELCLKN